MQSCCSIASSAFPGVWIRATSTLDGELEIGFVLALTILSTSHTAHYAGGIIGVFAPRSNTSVKRTRTGGAHLLVSLRSRTPVRAAYLER